MGMTHEEVQAAVELISAVNAGVIQGMAARGYAQPGYPPPVPTASIP
jgi:uncharacterized protein YoaH (UPF0181 family)